LKAKNNNNKLLWLWRKVHKTLLRTEATEKMKSSNERQPSKQLPEHQKIFFSIKTSV